MKRIFAILLLLLILSPSCGILNQAKEAKQFAFCEFSIVEAKLMKLGNVDVSEYTSTKDVGLTDMLMLGQQFLSGKLSASLSADIQVVNNQATKAAISGLRWQLYMKSEEYGGGELVKYIEVLPGETKYFTVVTDFNLLKLLTSEDLQSILDLVLDIENREKLQKLDISIRVKPYFKSGTTVKEYPGFITIRP